jgi:hypothetical protein
MEQDGRPTVHVREARELGEIGAALVGEDMPTIRVQLSTHLAEFALESWRRDYSQEVASSETYEQRIQRHRAGTLSLIGLAISERGKWDEGGVEVDLDPVLIGAAIEAADDLPSG